MACKSPPDGSPPRVWGRPAAFALVTRSLRFTPTRVGKTPGARRRAGFALVHPHACGEDAVGRCAVGSPGGSPPRVWGRHDVAEQPAAETRFTPTRVGKTRWPPTWHGSTSVHPHACGEDSANPARSSVARGSPPRVWGRLNLTRPGLRHPWFTPTRVGKTGWPGVARTGAVVHPHACGEDALGICGYEPWAGSPPRVWGRRLRWGKVYEVHRFTPTRVGKTFWAYARAGAALVHPHACGEDSLAARLCATSDGSPPRVWGRLQGPNSNVRV